MNRSPRDLSPHVAALLGIIVVLGAFLGLVYAIVLAEEQGVHAAEAAEAWNREIDLVGRMVGENLLKQQYQDVEEFLADWAARRPDLVTLRAVAPTGFVLVDHRRAIPHQRLIELSHAVVAGGRHLLTLEAGIDMTPLDRRMQGLAIRLIVLYGACVVLLAPLLWLTVRRLAILPLERSRSALADSERRYRTMVELSPDAVLVHRDGQIVFLNPAGRALLRAEAAGGLDGRAVADLIHPEDIILHDAALRSDDRGEARPLRVEGRLLRLDGTVVRVEMVSLPITFDGARAVQLTCRELVG